MSSAHRLITELPLDGVARLRKALREVWGVQFEDNVRALVEEEPWYELRYSVDELFLFWIRYNYDRNPSDATWLFSALRPTDRKFLLDELGLDRKVMVGLSPPAIAEKLLSHVGLPCRRVRGVAAIKADWNQLLELIESDEAEKAATFGRQQGERLLKTLLYFYSVTACVRTVVSIIREPGTLRIPKELELVSRLANGEADAALLAALGASGWADLGFLSLIVRKLSARLESNEAQSVTGMRLSLMTQQESETVDTFARALQNYAHFNPEHSAGRRDALLEATKGMCKYVAALGARSILPEEALVTEICESVFGVAFRARVSDGSEVTLVSEKLPRPAAWILLVARSRGRYAECWWAPALWNVAGPQD